MNYHRITYSSNEAEVGRTFPQSHVAKNVISIEDKLHLWKQDLGISLSSNIVLPQPVLHPNAKLTDLISTTSITLQLIISGKLKAILKSSIRPKTCDLLPVSVWYLNVEHNYWMLNPVTFDTQLIDFQKSEIWLHGSGNTKIKQLIFHNYTEFNEYGQQLALPQRLFIAKVVFVKKTNQDFIQLRQVAGGVGYYVSEKLKNEIQSAGCTGINFTTADI